MLANPSYITDDIATVSTERNGVPIGQKVYWLYVISRRNSRTNCFTRRKSTISLIYITENGRDEHNDPKLSLEEALADPYRIDFTIDIFIIFIQQSRMAVRFGINYVDYNDGLKRYPKLSAHWFKNFLGN
ncbi:hypothetical protein M0R45_017880 [Rubus argutus]|uniref:Uncharacterized protein n=1 Tax=Rubus argutus TaxID=59490 RepID=A0AAW1Y0A0_RUBAR